MVEVAGIALFLGDKILLCHPTNAKWWGSYSIPKGHIEKNETPKETAAREFTEETGIPISKKQLKNKPLKIKYLNGKKLLYVYFLYINNINEIGLESKVVPKKQLQLKEIDWCGFVKRDEAIKRINRNMLEILK